MWASDLKAEYVIVAGFIFFSALRHAKLRCDPDPIWPVTGLWPAKMELGVSPYHAEPQDSRPGCHGSPKNVWEDGWVGAAKWFFSSLIPGSLQSSIERPLLWLKGPGCELEIKRVTVQVWEWALDLKSQFMLVAGWNYFFPTSRHAILRHATEPNLTSARAPACKKVGFPWESWECVWRRVSQRGQNGFF